LKTKSEIKRNLKLCKVETIVGITKLTFTFTTLNFFHNLRIGAIS
jgi:hypothetical protein